MKFSTPVLTRDSGARPIDQCEFMNYDQDQPLNRPLPRRLYAVCGRSLDDWFVIPESTTKIVLCFSTEEVTDAEPAEADPHCSDGIDELFKDNKVRYRHYHSRDSEGYRDVSLFVVGQPIWWWVEIVS